MAERHTVESLPGARARITFQIAGETTAGEYRKMLQNYGKNIEIKGFRKGKVPRELLERKFGKELRAEAFQQIVEGSTREALPGVEPKALGVGDTRLCDEAGRALTQEAAGQLIESFQPGRDLQFSVAYETVPEVPLATLEGLQFSPVEVLVGEEDLSRELEELREQNSLMVERKDKPGQDGDTLSLEFVIREAGQEQPAEDQESELAKVYLGEKDRHGFEPKVRNLKSGESIVLVAHNFPDDENLGEEMRNKVHDVWLKVNSIHTRELPELDDDFAQDISEDYETLDELKKSTREKLEHNAQQLREKYSLLQIYHYWAAELEFAIPASMASYQVQGVMEKIKQSIGGEDKALMYYLALQYGSPQKGLRALKRESLLELFVELLRKKLLESKGWEAGDAEVEEELEHMARHQGQTAEQLKEQYSEQWPQVREHFAERALTSRLSKELVAEAVFRATSGPEQWSVKDLQERSKALEQSCQALVFERFSPFEPESPDEDPDENPDEN